MNVRAASQFPKVSTPVNTPPCGISGYTFLWFLLLNSFNAEPHKNAVFVLQGAVHTLRAALEIELLNFGRLFCFKHTDL